MAQATYITIEEFAEACDARALAQLGSDDGSPLTFSDPPVVGDDTDNILTNAIERASADVESAALRGGRYSATDLTDLVAADDWTIKGIVADLALVYMHERRSGNIPPDIERKGKMARDTLVDLREGRQVFNDSGAIEAGKPSIAVINASTRGRLGLVSDSPYFPRRNVRAY